MSAASAKPPTAMPSSSSFKPSFSSIDQLGGLARSGSKSNLESNSLKDSIMSSGAASSKPVENPMKTQINFEAFSDKSIG